MMRAVRARIVGEQQVRFEEFELVDRPEGTLVLARVERTLISAGTELAIYTGVEADAHVAGRWCAYPWTPGYAGVGTVLEAGEQAIQQGFVPGGRVVGPFSHASHAVIDTSSGSYFLVPDGVSSNDAAFLRIASIAFAAYSRSDVRLGDGVVVFGLGLVGNLGGQFYAAAGLHVTGVDPCGTRRGLAERTGFRTTFDPSGLEAAEIASRLMALQNGTAPRIVVDAVGDSRIIELGIQVVSEYGQVILLGTPRAPNITDSTNLLKLAHRRSLDLRGAREASGQEQNRRGQVILEMISTGSLRVGPLCSHVLAPDQLNRAYQGLLHQKDEYIGVLLDWDHEPLPSAG